MKKTTNKNEIKPIMTSGGLLTSEDVKAMKRLAKIKAEMKQLETELKPRIQDTVKAYGAGLVEIGGEIVELIERTRNVTTWKSVAYAVANEDVVNSIAPDFTVESTSYSAKIK